MATIMIVVMAVIVHLLVVHIVAPEQHRVEAGEHGKVLCKVVEEEHQHERVDDVGHSVVFVSFQSRGAVAAIPL